VNLIMDSFAALSLGTEKPTDELLKRKPYGRDSKIVTLIMWRNIIGQSIVQLIITFVILYGLDYSQPYPQPHLFIPGVVSAQYAEFPTAHYTLIFNSFVLMQLCNEINSRKLNNNLNVFEGLHTNFTFLGVLAFTLVVQVILVFVGGIAFNVVPLTGYQWLVCIVSALIMLVTGALLRFIPVPLEDWEVERNPEEIKKNIIMAADDSTDEEEMVPPKSHKKSKDNDDDNEKVKSQDKENDRKEDKKQVKKKKNQNKKEQDRKEDKKEDKKDSKSEDKDEIVTGESSMT